MNYKKTIQIPKIIHQGWGNRYGVSPGEMLLQMAKTWKEENPSWEYMFWDYNNLSHFLLENYPWFIERYYSFRYDAQRWDAIRYLILLKYGGVYADLDSECLEPLDWLNGKKDCCLALEPEEHCLAFNKKYVISNAFIATAPNHPFIKCIIDEISTNDSVEKDKLRYVLETTGPYMINRLYELYQEKKQIWLIPSELVSPVSKNEVQELLKEKVPEYIEEKIEKAYIIHYFLGSWLKNS